MKSFHEPISIVVGVLLVFALAPSPVLAQNTGRPARAAQPVRAEDREVKDVYHVIRVEQLDVQEGVQLPSEYLGALQEEATKQLADSKVFQEVLHPGQNPASSEEPVLRLTGTITGYSAGSRAERYISYGSGAAEIDARIVFLDGRTSQPVITEGLRAQMLGGIFGGSAANITKDFAEQVVTRTKLLLVKRIPVSDEATAPPVPAPSGDASPAAGQRHIVTISSKDWSGSQRKLDQAAADGYRLLGLSLNGKNTADIEFAKSAEALGLYQYRLLHTIRSSSLQKDINKVTEDGFRLAERTLSSVEIYVILIMAKPPVPFADRYTYLITEARSISNAQKDTEKEKLKGIRWLKKRNTTTLFTCCFSRS